MNITFQEKLIGKHYFSFFSFSCTSFLNHSFSFQQARNTDGDLLINGTSSKTNATIIPHVSRSEMFSIIFRKNLVSK